MESFWNEGLAVLKTLINEDQIQNISEVRARQIFNENKLFDEDLLSDLTKADSYVVLADQIPRVPENAHNWSSETVGYFNRGIEPFINDIEDDPHTRYD